MLNNKMCLEMCFWRTKLHSKQWLCVVAGRQTSLPASAIIYKLCNDVFLSSLMLQRCFFLHTVQEKMRSGGAYRDWESQPYVSEEQEGCWVRRQCSQRAVSQGTVGGAQQMTVRICVYCILFGFWKRALLLTPGLLVSILLSYVYALLLSLSERR